MEKNYKNKQLLAPHLIIEGPDARKSIHKIEKNSIIIGRLKSDNDISLTPDTQKLITRYMHCSIEYEINSYWVIDNASKNGTFLQRQDGIKRIVGKEKLQNNDVILILGNIDSDSQPKYWRLKFSDPCATEDIGNIFQQSYLFYDWIQAKLYICQNNDRNEITGLSPQEHKLIRFMQQKNNNNKNTAVMCSYDEIIEAVWEDLKNIRTKSDVNHLIAGLRKKFEPDPNNPRYLLNIRGMGYRIITRTDL